MLEFEAMVECGKWINLKLKEQIKTTSTLLKNWLLWDFVSQCNHSTDSNNLKVAMKNSLHAGKLPVTPLFKN